ncbi:MAG: hypothetical protein LIO74_04595 [Ruminococcus sp.]|nr:hypothetical protein [Ruminococcus sp.]
MKKRMISLILLSIALFSGCSDAIEPEENIDTTEYEYTLNEKIYSIGDNGFYLLEEETNSLRDISCNGLTDQKNVVMANLSVGDSVCMTYNGEVAECDPERIDHIYSVEILEKADPALQHICYVTDDITDNAISFLMPASWNYSIESYDDPAARLDTCYYRITVMPQDSDGSLVFAAYMQTSICDTEVTATEECTLDGYDANVHYFNNEANWGDITIDTGDVTYMIYTQNIDDTWWESYGNKVNDIFDTIMLCFAH